VGAISSVFNVSTDGEFNTGYIMELESVREGAITIPENYHFDPGVTVAVTLPLLRLVYVSVVRRNQSILQLISSMLGSLAGEICDRSLECLQGSAFYTHTHDTLSFDRLTRPVIAVSILHVYI